MFFVVVNVFFHVINFLNVCDSPAVAVAGGQLKAGAGRHADRKGGHAGGDG